MPLGYVDAELALEYKGVKVYHTYKHDMVDNEPREYWFVLEPDECEAAAFDVRDLGLLALNNLKMTPLDTLRAAITAGIITPYMTTLGLCKDLEVLRKNRSQQ